jgi:hypothetical protein
MEAGVRAVAANPLRSTPWVPAYYDQLDYRPFERPPPATYQSRRGTFAGRGTLSVTLTVTSRQVTLTGIGDLAATAHPGTFVNLNWGILAGDGTLSATAV